MQRVQLRLEDLGKEAGEDGTETGTLKSWMKEKGAEFVSRSGMFGRNAFWEVS